jgi:hypothetical protein
MFKSILNDTLSGLSGKYVVVNVIGAVSIPYVIPKFQFVGTDSGFMFDDEDSENFQFEISYDSTNWVEYEDGIISFEIENHGFRTILEIVS